MLKKPNQQKKKTYKAQPKPSKAEEAVYASIVGGLFYQIDF